MAVSPLCVKGVGAWATPTIGERDGLGWFFGIRRVTGGPPRHSLLLFASMRSEGLGDEEAKGPW